MMRTFPDATGREWTVFEVRRPPMERPAWPDESRTLGVTRWLCFESKGAKRRLTPVPPEWRVADPTELAHMLTRARPVGKQKLDHIDEARDVP